MLSVSTRLSHAEVGPVSFSPDHDPRCLRVKVGGRPWRILGQVAEIPLPLNKGWGEPSGPELTPDLQPEPTMKLLTNTLKTFDQSSSLQYTSPLMSFLRMIVIFLSLKTKS